MSKNFQLDIKKGQEIGEDFIAEIRNRFKMAFFLYKRKKSRWVSLYAKIQALTE